MTLILTASNDEYSVLVADRQITDMKTNEILYDNYNKVIIAFFDNAKISLALTGHATSTNFDAIIFLTNFFKTVGTTDVYQMLHKLESELNLRFNQADLVDKYFLVILTGFTYDNNGTYNFLKKIEKLPNGIFETHNLDKEKSYFDYAGDSKGLEVLQNKCEKIVNDIPNPHNMLHFLVSTIKKIAYKKTTIGGNCSFVIIPKKINHRVFNTHYTDDPSMSISLNPVFFNTTGGGLFTEMLTLTTEMILTGPVLKKNQTCWCGSELRFKDCHLKKFGNINSSMIPMSWVKLDNPVLSGQIFQVDSFLK